MRRIRSGIRAAQDAGKWTGRPPFGFTVEDGYLRVEPEEFLRVREAIERVVAGEQTVDVADDLGLPQSSLSRLASERRELYLRGEADDERLDAAVEEIEPLPDPPESQQSFEERVQQVVENMDLQQ
jgi:hypothetical protein